MIPEVITRLFRPEKPYWLKNVSQSYAILMDQLREADERLAQSDDAEITRLATNIWGRVKGLRDTIYGNRLLVPHQFEIRKIDDDHRLGFYTPTLTVREVPVINAGGGIPHQGQIDSGAVRTTLIPLREWCSDTALVKKIAIGLISNLPNGESEKVRQAAAAYSQN